MQENEAGEIVRRRNENAVGELGWREYQEWEDWEGEEEEEEAREEGGAEPEPREAMANDGEDDDFVFIRGMRD